MKNIFNKLYLDKIYLQSLEVCAIKEGFVNKRIDGDKLTSYSDYYPINRNILKSKTLLMLTLFEEIDSSCTTLDFSSFVDEGLISNKSAIFNGFQRRDFQSPSLNNISSNRLDDAFMFSEVASLQILNRFKREAIKDYIKKSPKNFHKKVSKYKYREHPDAPLNRDLPDGYSSLDWGKASHKDLSREYLHLIEHLYRTDDTYDYLYQNFNIPFAFGSYLKYLKWNLHECIYFSILENASFASGLCTTDPVLENSAVVNLVDNLYYFVRTKLADEILILPAPNNLKEVISIRKHKEISSFREVLSVWCHSVMEGDIYLENKIRKDIKKSSEALRMVGKWQEFKASPINFWLNTIGGHIPIFSNVLTVATSAADAYQYYVNRNYNWIMFVR